MPLAPGTTIGRYRIESRIGGGAMGVVYLALDTRLERRVALKLIEPSLAADPDFRARFEREARAAAALDHPHVLPVYEAGEDDGQLYLAMRYVPGVDLATQLARHGPLDLPATTRLVTQLAAALDAAHASGLIHRDVKPANVLLAPDQHAYLADFGLARSAGTGITRPGQLVGTADYTAPELLTGASASPASDIYALACLAVECLTGRPPFTRDGELATLYAHANDPIPELSDQLPELPPGLQAVFERGLAKEPAARYASAGALASALAGAAGGAPASTASRPRLLRWRPYLLGSGGLLAAAVVGWAWMGGSGGGGGGGGGPSLVASPASPSASGVGSGLTGDAAVVRSDGASSNIYLMEWSRPDTARRLTSQPGCHTPEWSPDGFQLAFICENPPRLGSDFAATEAYVIEVGTGLSEPDSVSSFGEAAIGATDLAWQPDGTLVVASGPVGVAGGQCPPFACGLEFFDANGVSRFPIGALLSVAISPSSGELVYVGLDPESGIRGLYSLDALDDIVGEPRALDIGSSDRLPGSLAWSPDGARIALSMESPVDNDLDVYLYEVVSGELTPLLSGPTSDGNPSWSPDGRWLTFTSDRDGPPQIWAVEVGTGALPVPRTEGPLWHFEAAWRPPGE